MKMKQVFVSFSFKFKRKTFSKMVYWKFLNAENVEDVLINFIRLGKLFGFFPFIFPSNKLKYSKTVLISTFVVMSSLIFHFVDFLRMFFTFVRPASSEIYLVGINIIEILFFISLLICYVAVLFQGKSFYNLIDMFKRFDKHVSACLNKNFNLTDNFYSFLLRQRSWLNKIIQNS